MLLGGNKNRTFHWKWVSLRAEKVVFQTKTKTEFFLRLI